MRIHFWGVRGSIPSPLNSEQIQAKISSVVQRITAQDIVDQDSRERFVDSLPQWLFGTIGGNTPCVELETNSGDTIIFDAGTGIRELGIHLQNQPEYKQKPQLYHLFFTHFHWDHIQGLPFFNPAYDPRNTIIVYSTNPEVKTILEGQMKWPYFPIPMLGKGGFGARFEFRYIKPDDPLIAIGSAHVAWHHVRHPGGCTAYSVQENNKKLIFSTDTELSPQDFEKTDPNNVFYENADMLIIDAQYTMPDSLEKTGWGHSSFSLAIDFARSWNIKKVALFHHEPTYNDKKIISMQENAKHYRDHMYNGGLEIFSALEGTDLYL